MNDIQRFAFLDDATAEELRAFAVYVASLAPEGFDAAAAFVRERRGASAVPAPVAVPVVPERAPVAVPRGVTPLYDWAAEGDFPAADVPANVPGVPAPPPVTTPVLAPAPDTLCPVAAERFALDLAEGRTPALVRIKRELHVGQPRAVRIRAYLASLAAA